MRDSLHASLRASLRNSLRASLHATLRASLRDSLYASLHASLRDKPLQYQWTYFWGAHEAYWTQWYRAAHAIGVPFKDEDLQRLTEYEVTVQHGLWAWPFKNGVVVCDRPTELHMEESPIGSGQHRLHRTDGPALLFGDGFAIHAWHGVRVPAKVIERPAEITIAEINAEPNAEVRRVMLERFGLDRYLRESEAKRIDAYDDANLWEIAPPTDSDEPLKLLELTNSTDEPDGTRKKYVFSVPPEMERALQAKAWQYGVEEGNYAPFVETCPTLFQRWTRCWRSRRPCRGSTTRQQKSAAQGATGWGLFGSTLPLLSGHQGCAGSGRAIDIRLDTEALFFGASRIGFIGLYTRGCVVRFRLGWS